MSPYGCIMRYEIISPRKPVLVVADDDPDLRSIMVQVLRTDGHDVESADCGADLLARLSRTPDPSLVVTDLKMPWLDGLEVLERAERMGLFVPGILCTAYADHAVQQRAGELHVPVLPKPIDLRALRREVESALRDVDFWREPEHDGISEIRRRARRLPV